MNTTDIDLYMAETKDTVILSAECEQELARKLRDNDDKSAEHKLIRSQLRFVVFLARRYTGYGLPLEDLIQEGNIGLTKAVRRFDPEKGIRLTTFASHAIRSEIHEFVIKNWSIVKVATTAEHRKLFFKLRSSKKTLGNLNQTDIVKLAKDLSVTPVNVREMEFRMSGGDTSIDMLRATNNDSGTMTLADTIPDDRPDPYVKLEATSESRESTKQLKKGMKALDQISRDVLQAKWLGADKAGLRAVCEKYKLAPSQVKQIEHKAMKKMRMHLLTT